MADEKPNLDKPLWTPFEVAHLLDVTHQTLANWRHQGQGPPYFKLGPGSRTAVRYRPSVVREWLDKREQYQMGKLEDE